MLIGVHLNLKEESFLFKFKTLLLLSTSKGTTSSKRCLKQHFLKIEFLKTCCDELDQFVCNEKLNQIIKCFDKSMIKCLEVSLPKLLAFCLKKKLTPLHSKKKKKLIK